MRRDLKLRLEKLAASKREKCVMIEAYEWEEDQLLEQYYAQTHKDEQAEVIIILRKFSESA